MKKIILALMLCMSYLTSFAQKDSTIFKGYLSNNEYEVYLQINFYQNDIKVPGQEIFGTIAGFLGDRKDNQVVSDSIARNIQAMNTKEASGDSAGDAGAQEQAQAAAQKQNEKNMQLGQ